MANIAGAQECSNEDEEGRSDIESDREDQAAIPQLKSFKEAIPSKNSRSREYKNYLIASEASLLHELAGAMFWYIYIKTEKTF